jgi:hypothetical protein
MVVMVLMVLCSVLVMDDLLILEFETSLSSPSALLRAVPVQRFVFPMLRSLVCLMIYALIFVPARRRCRYLSDG